MMLLNRQILSPCAEKRANAKKANPQFLEIIVIHDFLIFCFSLFCLFLVLFFSFSRTSISTFASGSGRDPSSSSGDAVFDYEDSNSISEEEEEEEEVSTAEEIVDSPSGKYFVFRISYFVFSHYLHLSSSFPFLF